MSEAKIKVVEDLPGVGPAIAEKLKDAGYDTPVSYTHLTLPTILLV